MLTRRLFLGLALTLAITSLARAGGSADPRIEQVQSDVRALIQAGYQSDVDTLLRLTHPGLIAALGGKDQARQAIAQQMQQAASLGVKLESLSFPQPPDFLEAGGRKFAIVPTLAVVNTKGQRMERLNYQFGVFEPSLSQWTYLEGSRVNKDTVQKLFPGFPADYTFPPTARKPL